MSNKCDQMLNLVTLFQNAVTEVMIKDKENFTVMLVSPTIKAACCYQSACPSACSVNTCTNICSKGMGTRHCPAHCWGQCQWASTAGQGQGPSEKATKAENPEPFTVFHQRNGSLHFPMALLTSTAATLIESQSTFQLKNTQKRINITHFDEETPISNLHLVPQPLISSLCSGSALESIWAAYSSHCSDLFRLPCSLIRSCWVCVRPPQQSCTWTFDHSWIPAVRNTQQSHLMQGTDLFGLLLL